MKDSTKSEKSYKIVALGRMWRYVMSFSQEVFKQVSPLLMGTRCSDCRLGRDGKYKSLPSYNFKLTFLHATIEVALEFTENCCTAEVTYLFRVSCPIREYSQNNVERVPSLYCYCREMIT